MALVATLKFSTLYTFHTPQAVFALQEAEGHHGGRVAVLGRQAVPTRVSN